MKFLTVCRLALILCGMALIGVSMFQMPPWFRNWFIGVFVVVSALFQIAHDCSKPKDKP